VYIKACVCVVGFIMFVVGCLVRGWWGNLGVDSADKPQKSYNRRRLVGLESGGQYETEFYWMSKYNLETLKRIEGAHGCLDCDRDVYESRVKPILASAEKVKDVEILLGYK